MVGLDLTSSSASTVNYRYRRGPGAEAFGFRLDTDGVIRVCQSDGSGGMCNSGWQELTDPATVRITEFTVATVRSGTRAQPDNDEPLLLPCPNVCTGATREIRTVQVDRSLGITVGVPVTQTITTLGFDPATGRLMVAPIDLPEPASVPFLIEVKNDSLGGFVTSMEITGRPTVCSPGGTVSGVNACP